MANLSKDVEPNKLRVGSEGNGTVIQAAFGKSLEERGRRKPNCKWAISVINRRVREFWRELEEAHDEIAELSNANSVEFDHSRPRCAERIEICRQRYRRIAYLRGVCEILEDEVQLAEKRVKDMRKGRWDITPGEALRDYGRVFNFVDFKKREKLRIG